MRRLLVLAGLCAAGCGGAEPPTPVASNPFAYERAQPLGFRDHGVAERGDGVVVRDVSYASPRGGRVRGFLALPRRRPSGAVILLHGAGGDRMQLLEQSRRLADRGLAALTIDSPFARPGARRAHPGLEGLAGQIALFEQEVVDLRRAVDVLRARTRVSSARIGFLGWSAGGRAGAILAGVEPRIRSYVLVAAGAVPVAEYVRLAPPEARPRLRRLLDRVDPLRWIRRARPRTILFQSGRRDAVVPRRALRAVIAAAPKSQQVRWYDAGHVPTDEMWAEAVDWLERRLGANQ